MLISRHQVKLLHTLKGKLGLSEADYRRALLLVGDVTSTKELTRERAEAMIGLFEHWGLDARKTEGPDFGERPGMASYAQLELIRALWREYTRDAYEGEEELNKWLRAKFKVSSLRFLTKRGAQGAITALKAMKARVRA